MESTVAKSFSCNGFLSYIQAYMSTAGFCPSPFQLVIHFSICQDKILRIPGLIHSKSSSLESSWSGDVQRCAHLPVWPLEPCSQGGGPSSDCSLFILSDFLWWPRKLLYVCNLYFLLWKWRFNENVQYIKVDGENFSIRQSTQQNTVIDNNYGYVGFLNC